MRLDILYDYSYDFMTLKLLIFLDMSSNERVGI